MSKEGQDFDLHRGRARDLVFVVKDQDGNAVAHAGVTATWLASKGIGQDAVLTKTNGDGLVVDQDPTESTLRVTVTLASADTVSLAAASYLHELGIEGSDGKPYVVATGRMHIKDTNLAPEAA